MKRLSIKSVAEFCCGQCNVDGFIEKISTDSRDIDENTLFVALVGERFDAHDFIKDVLSKGAKAVVCSKRVCDDDRLILVEDTGKALLDIAHGYRKTFNIPFVALTGSVGKTTTKGMVYAVVKQKFNTLRTAGNLNNEIGDPKTLFCLEENHEAAVIEMGMNHFDEISRLSHTVEPDVACITNVGTAHIENLGSREGILKAKTEILHGMKKGSPLIINGDNDMLAGYDNADFKIIRFGIDGECLDMRATDIKSYAEGMTFVAHYGGESAQVYVPAVGVHNVYNALCAMCVGIQLGYSLEEAASGVKLFEAEGMRQKVTEFKDMIFIEDCYNANLDSMCASLETLKTLKKSRSIAVLGDMLELGDFSAQAHAQVGQKAYETSCDIVLTFGNDAEHIASAFSGKGGFSRHFADKAELTSYLMSILQKGDTILFKGSRGMKMEEIFNYIYENMG